jgi:hypothetical protein
LMLIIIKTNIMYTWGFSIYMWCDMIWYV